MDWLRALALLSSVSMVAACDKPEGDDNIGGDDANDGSADSDEDSDADSEDQDEDENENDGDEDEDEDEDENDGAEDDAEPEPEDLSCTEQSAAQTCSTDAITDGIRFCDTLVPGGELTWGECLESAECMPGELESCGFCDDPESEDCATFGDGNAQCRLYDGIPSMDYDECNTPLVLSFDGAPVQMQPTPAATFDINAAGGCITTDWPAATTPWLALDRDRSGSIEDGRELFGSGTRLVDGKAASNGFQALSELDDNGDGRIDALDASFADLVLWSDHDGDKASTLTEMEPLAIRGVLSIELSYDIDRRCDDRGNCEVERASFTFIERGGEIRNGDVIDVHLACQ